MVDKVIIGNLAALRQKYGAANSSVVSAIKGLIASDSASGLTTVFLPVDDAAKMAPYQVAPAIMGNEASFKAAVDAIYRKEKPSYIVLLGAPDLVPHISLDNPTFNPSAPTDDPDLHVTSDLPYACDAPFSSEPSDFVGPTRVVTRLPDIQGAQSPDALLSALSHASTATSLSRQAYTQCLGVSAWVWSQSTSMSLAAVFGVVAKANNVPPSTYQWSAQELGYRSHFFNCHGSPNTKQYFGQRAKRFPPSHDADYIAGKLTEGVVLAAECCYGAQLYDPARGNGLSIANTYIKEGAHAVWGSTTIAYGPSNKNGQADLICQYFFQEILAGSSVGMAALTARQRFAAQSATLSPTDLKTLIQFIALGDASIHPVATPAAKVATPPANQKFASLISSLPTQARLQRRNAATQDGQLQSLFRRRTSAKSIGASTVEVKRVLGIARSYGFESPSMTSKPVLTPDGPKMVLGASNLEADDMNEIDVFHLVFEHLADGERFQSRRILEIGESDGQVRTVEELFSR